MPKHIVIGICNVWCWNTGPRSGVWASKQIVKSLLVMRPFAKNMVEFALVGLLVHAKMGVDFRHGRIHTRDIDLFLCH